MINPPNASIRRLILVAIMPTLFFGPNAIGAPTTGAYTEDRTNTWVQDQVLESVGNVNMIMCFMGALRPEINADGENYLALVDGDACDRAGGGSTTQSSAASSAISYANVIVNSSRPSTTEPLSVKAWVDEVEDQADIYTLTSISQGPSSSNPNGVFTLRFAGYPKSAPTTRQFIGALSATGSNLSFFEEGANYDESGNTSETAMAVTFSGTESGAGRVFKREGNEPPTNNLFAYNATHFKRGNADNTAQCFSRREADASTSVYRYGVYKSDGSRLTDVDGNASTEGGFPITYSAQSVTYYGWAGYHGVFLSDNAGISNGDSVTRADDSGLVYTYNAIGGKLIRNTKGTTTLGETNGQLIQYWSQSDGRRFFISWTGNAFELLSVEECGNSGCTRRAPNNSESAPTATSLRASNQLFMFGYSDAIGGSISLNVPSSGDFSNTTSVNYTQQSTVSPSDANALTLHCTSECLKPTLEIESHVSNPSSSPYETVGGDTYNWGAVLVGNAKVYTFSSGMMRNAANHDIDASGVNLADYQNNWGFRTGPLVNLADAKCDSQGVADPNGTHICSNLASTYYQWETGPNNWNKLVTLTKADNSVVQFEPPTKMTLTLSTSNSTLASTDPKIGSKIFLDFNGFDSLYGIPWTCVDPETNERSQICNNTSKYVPEFGLKAGAAMTAVGGSTTYYVRPLDEEKRFGLDPQGCAGLTLQEVTLPTNSAVSVDPKDSIGLRPTVSGPPRVIHGVPQTQ